MSLKTALVARLNAHEGLTALINGRVYPKFIPQDGALPCVVYQRISSPRQYTMGSTAAVVEPRFQLTCWAMSEGGAEAVKVQVLAALNHATGSIGTGANTFTIMVCLAANEGDDYEPDTKRYCERVDFKIMYNE